MGISNENLHFEFGTEVERESILKAVSLSWLYTIIVSGLTEFRFVCNKILGKNINISIK